MKANGLIFWEVQKRAKERTHLHQPMELSYVFP
jgi:hypothetical protein